VTQTQYLQTPGTPQVNTAGNLGSLAGQLYGMNKMGGYAEGGRVEEGQGWNEEDLLRLLAFLQGEGTSSQRHPSEKSDRRSEPQHDIRTLIEHCFA
jgi:hypothetical protein